MEKFKAGWRAFFAKADKVMLAVLLGLLYLLGVGLARVLASVFARRYVGCQPSGWQDAADLSSDLESSERQS